MTARSWNSRIENAERPWRVVSYQCHRRRGAKQKGGNSQRDGGEQHLGPAHSEQWFTHDPQSARLQLEPDDEQQQHHTEFAEMQDLLDIRDEPQSPGTDDDTGAQVAQHCPQSKPFGQRDGNNGRAEKHGDLSKQTHCNGGSAKTPRHSGPERSGVANKLTSRSCRQRVSARYGQTIVRISYN
jgi:hypothetical protein